MRLIELFVNNLDTKPHTVQVLVQDDGDPVYWNSMEAEAFDTEEERAGGGAFEGYPTEPGKFDIYARYDELPPGEWSHFGFRSVADNYSGDSDVPCVRVHLQIGGLAEQSDPPRLSILTSVEC